MTAADRALCATTARWLQASSGALGALGMASVLAAVLLLATRAPWPGLAAAALLLALAERVLALRTRFDAGLFSDLAQASGALDLLDAALQGLQLRTSSATTAAQTPPRPLPDRVRGARRLSAQHALVVLLQFAAVALQLTLATGGAPP